MPFIVYLSHRRRRQVNKPRQDEFCVCVDVELVRRGTAVRDSGGEWTVELGLRHCVVLSDTGKQHAGFVPRSEDGHRYDLIRCCYRLIIIIIIIVPLIWLRHQLNLTSI